MPKRKLQSRPETPVPTQPILPLLTAIPDLWTHHILPYLNNDERHHVALVNFFFYKQTNNYVRNQLLSLLRSQPHPLSEAESREIVSRLKSPRKAYFAYRKLLSFSAIVLETDLLQTLKNNLRSDLTWSVLDDNIITFQQALPNASHALHFLPAAVAIGSVDLIEYLLRTHSEHISLDMIRYLVEVAIRTAQPRWLDFFLNIAKIVFNTTINLDEHAFLSALQSRNVHMVDKIIALTTLEQLNIDSGMLWANVIPFMAVLSGDIGIVQRLEELYERIGALFEFQQELYTPAVESGNPDMFLYIDERVRTVGFTLSYCRELLDSAIATRNIKMVEKVLEELKRLNIVPLGRTELTIFKLIRCGTPAIFDLVFQELELHVYLRPKIINSYITEAILSGEVAMVCHLIKFLNERGQAITVSSYMLDLATVNAEMYQFMQQWAQQTTLGHVPDDASLACAIESYDVTLLKQIIPQMDRVKLPTLSKHMFQACYHLSLMTNLPAIHHFFSVFCQHSHIVPLIIHLNNPFTSQYIQTITHKVESTNLVSMKNC